jgi:hypothetical protein
MLAGSRAVCGGAIECLCRVMKWQWLFDQRAASSCGGGQSDTLSLFQACISWPAAGEELCYYRLHWLALMVRHYLNHGAHYNFQFGFE